jgi:hypothetical protein
VEIAQVEVTQGHLLVALHFSSVLIRLKSAVKQVPESLDCLGVLLAGNLARSFELHNFAQSLMLLQGKDFFDFHDLDAAFYRLRELKRLKVLMSQAHVNLEDAHNILR